MTRPIWQKLIRQHLLAVEPYEPVQPLETLAAKVGLPVDKLIKLDANENPYGCSPRVLETVAEFRFYHIYPDPLQRDLRQALAVYVGLGPEFIAAGVGSDELIDLVLRCFLEPGDQIITAVPSFGMYPAITDFCGGQTIAVRRTPTFELDMPAMKKALTGRTKAIVLASPNNPTGNIVPEEQVRELLATGVLVVVDEAYQEFSGVTVAPLVPRHDNLIVLRTFSKWAGLAGFRVGYGVFPPALAELIYQLRVPYSVSTASQLAAMASLKDVAHLRRTVAAILAEREKLFVRLAELEFLEPLPTRANFILCRVVHGDARRIKEGLERKGIFVRYFNTPLLQNFLRISVGKPEHTEALVRALREVEAA